MRSSINSNNNLATRCQRGASLVEFSIIGFTLVLVGLFTLQMGLLYHAKTTLNYAVFEAARTGSVNQASISAMRSELGARLAPLEGGDGTKGKAASAIAKSLIKINNPLHTRIVILNPTQAAFTDWAVRDASTGKRFIPVNHLRHQTHELGPRSGLSLRDANLLKIQVTHGVKLRVPVIGKIMVKAMGLLDPHNALFYLDGKWPLQAVAIVRMQSDALEEEVIKSASASQGGGESEDQTHVAGSMDDSAEGSDQLHFPDGPIVVIDDSDTSAGQGAGGEVLTGGTEMAEGPAGVTGGLDMADGAADTPDGTELAGVDGDAPDGTELAGVDIDGDATGGSELTDGTVDVTDGTLLDSTSGIGSDLTDTGHDQIPPLASQPCEPAGSRMRGSLRVSGNTSQSIKPPDLPSPDGSPMAAKRGSNKPDSRRLISTAEFRALLAEKSRDQDKAK